MADMPHLAYFFAGKSLQFVSDWLEENNLSKFIKPVFEKTAREECLKAKESWARNRNNGRDVS